MLKFLSRRADTSPMSNCTCTWNVRTTLGFTRAYAPTKRGALRKWHAENAAARETLPAGDREAFDAMAQAMAPRAVFQPCEGCTCG